MGDFEDYFYRTRCSEKSLQEEPDGFFMDFVNLVKNAAGDTWIETTFGNLKNDAERIRCIYTAVETKQAVLNVLSNVQEIYRKKDAAISQLKRLEAEVAFETGDLNKSLLLYSQSIIRAPKTGQCCNYDSGLSLTLALWQRSQVLIALQEFSSALTDIQQALKEHLPNVFKAEAYWKMGICYKALKEEQKSKVSFDLAEKLLENKERLEELRKDRDLRIEYVDKHTQKIVPTLDGMKHKKYPYASKKLSLKCTENLGRHMVANDEIKTGETLAVEAPYAACLKPGMFGTHCHHCFNRLRAPVACSECSNVAFCGTVCKVAALSTYHAYECKYLDLLIGSGMSVLSHTALRIVTQQTLEKCLDMCKNKSTETLFSLCTNSEKREPADFLQRTLMAAFLLRCLQKCGYFHRDDNDVLPSEDELIVGELLLYNLQMLQFNAHEVLEQLTTCDFDLKASRLSYIGVAVYPTVALLNHHCYPAVSRYFVGNNIVIKAIRPLQPNDVVAENYGPTFIRKSLKDRQRLLSSRYWFQCKCDACIFNWPLESEMKNASKSVRCSNENCLYLFTLPLQNNNVTCPKCTKNVNLEENIKLLSWCEDQYNKALKYMQTKEFEKCVAMLYEPIDIFHRISCPPHRLTHLAQEALQICLFKNGNTSNTLVKNI